PLEFQAWTMRNVTFQRIPPLAVIAVAEVVIDAPTLGQPNNLLSHRAFSFHPVNAGVFSLFWRAKTPGFAGFPRFLARSTALPN
ncbi:MAG: hypothetical protein ACYC3X_29420, partial [Pirellulaceae bacterium]